MATLEACIPALRRYAATLLHDRQEADYLVRDCLVRALDQLHTRRDDDVRVWLFAIMYNLFMSRTRFWRRRREPIETVKEVHLGTNAGQNDHAETDDVLHALKSLPVEQRSVLFLVSVEDLPYATVAQILRIPLQTTMSRLALGRDRLRQIMTGEAPGARQRLK
jgi:RNA polymerase sigma-70 factor (ECF subfamily)